MQQRPWTWADLRALREDGRRPALPVFVTTAARFAGNLLDAGVAAILHAPGRRMPVDLLEGLDVILDLGPCGRAGAVRRLCDAHGVTCRLTAWCACDGELTLMPRPCGGAP
jgi:hypothetical protein